MSIRRKSFILVLLTLAMVYGLMLNIITVRTDSFIAELENKQLTTDLLRIGRFMEDQENQLRVKLSDWSQWDDTFQFVQDFNQAYVDSNLQQATLENLKIDGMLFAEGTDHIFYMHVAVNGGTPIVPLSDLAELFSPERLRQIRNSKLSSGILSYNPPILFAMMPITDSVRTKPSNGSLIFFRTFSEAYVSYLSEVSHNPLHLVSPKLSGEASETYIQFPELPHYRFSIDTSQERTAIGKVDYISIDGFPSVSLTTEFPRDIRAIGRENTKNLLLLLIISGTGITVLIVIVLDRYLLGRIDRIVRAVKSIGERRAFAERVPDIGVDELGQLSRSINVMLRELEDAYRSGPAMDMLREEVADRTRELEVARDELKRQNDEYQRKNAMLEDTKNAVLNVLDDARILEEELTAERDRMNATLESIGDILFVIDPEFRIIQMNTQAARIFRVQREHVIGQNLKQLYKLRKNGQEIPFEDRMIFRVFTERKPQSFSLEDNYEMETVDGNSFPVSGIVTPLIRNGEVTAAISVVRDVTNEKESFRVIERTVEERTRELREKNQALEAAQAQISEGWLSIQREKARLSASINSLSFGFVLMDTDRNIVYSNTATKQIFGIDHDPTALSELERLLPDTPIKHVHEAVEKESSPQHLREIPLGPRIVNVFISPISMVVLGKKQTIGTLMVIEDITEHKAIERSRDEFFSIASHELRTPLTAIRGNTALILDHFTDRIAGTDMQEMVTDIHDSSVRLITIVNDFLDMSRLEMGRMPFHPEPFDMAELAREISREFDTTGSEHGTEIRVEADAPASLAYADRNKVKQVLVNLVGNALKFTDHGTVSIRVRESGGVIHVEVSDTGPGIAPAQQSLLFRKFQQAGQSTLTRDVTGGTGLGLYISKLLVESMGGTIGLVRSDVGQGSCFGFSIPTTEAPKVSEPVRSEVTVLA